jgi:1D-myo-inositol 3-kinase
VGHICRDVTDDGYVVGGAAAYSSIAAHSLGARARVLTSHDPAFEEYRSLPETVSITVKPAEDSTTFHNTYDGGARTQLLLGRGATIGGGDVPSDWGRSDVLYLCPIADEVEPSVLQATTGSVIGVTPQGWFRTWDDAGVVSAKKWAGAEAVLPHVDVCVLSEEDIAAFPEELDRFRSLTKRVVFTHGAGGATLYAGDEARHFPAYEARQVDPTGAGDVFATAYLLYVAAKGDPVDAMAFGNCVASFAVEDVGTKGIPAASRVLERWSGPLPDALGALLASAPR